MKLKRYLIPCFPNSINCLYDDLLGSKHVAASVAKQTKNTAFSVKRVVLDCVLIAGISGNMIVYHTSSVLLCI